MCRLHVPSRMRSLEHPLTLSLSSYLAPFPTTPLGHFRPRPSSPSGNCRKTVGSVREDVGNFRKAIGNFPSCIARWGLRHPIMHCALPGKLSTNQRRVFQPISDEYFRLRHPIMHCALKNREYIRRPS